MESLRAITTIYTDHNVFSKELKKIKKQSKSNTRYNMNPEKYVIITPVRDEEAYLEHTIKSIISQTTKPADWIIVNDGSTDNTGRIINRYSQQYSWIHAIHRENRGFRKSGGGVVEAFYEGYESVKSSNWDFIVKLDGDLGFSADYFERCFQHFRKNPKLGIGGGVILNVVNGRLLPEKHPHFHVRGATKIYRRQCWDAIGGLIKSPGWDTIDEVKANMHGWQTQSFSETKLIHYRFTGQADGTWRNHVKNGRGSYISGYHPLFMLFKCLKRAFQRPYIMGSLGLLCGFASGYVWRIPRVNDKELITYIRRQQLNRLLMRESIWK